MFGQVQLVREETPAEYKIYTPTLKDLSEDIYRGMNVSSKSIEEGDGNYRLIKLSDVQEGQLRLEQLTRVSLERKSHIEKYLVETGDVIISNRGHSIKIAVVPEHEGDIILSHNFIGIRASNRLDPYYLKAFLESPLGMYYLTKNQVGTNILTINPKDLKDIPIKLLEINEQQELGQSFLRVEQEYIEKIKQAESERTDQILKLYGKMGIRNSFEMKN